MSRAFIHVEFDDRDCEEPPEIKVFYDEGQILIGEVEEGCCFDLTELADESYKIKNGYYFVNYGWSMERESFECSVEYAVIDEWNMTRSKLGWFYLQFLKFYYFCADTNKYHQPTRTIETRYF